MIAKDIVQQGLYWIRNTGSYPTKEYLFLENSGEEKKVFYIDIDDRFIYVTHQEVSGPL